MNAPQNLPVVYSMSDLEKMATQMVKSKLFGVENVEQAVTLMLVAQAEGQHPASAARDYHVIKGRPSMKADAMLARFQKAGGIVEWQDYTDTKVSGAFSHPNSPKPVLVEWTFEMARKIGLTGKDNWRNYPRAMLRARVISEGVRTCYPVIATGIYTPEEIHDFAPEKDITPTAGYFKELPAARQDVVSQTAMLIREHMDNDRPLDALGLIEGSGFDAEETIACWSLLPSDHRSALKRLQAAAKAKDAGRISDAQRKRLEARIGELKLNRETVKRHCADAYSVSHFADLSIDQYQELDAALDGMGAGKTTDSASPQTAAPATASAAIPPAPTSAGDADLITEKQEGAILDLLEAHGVTIKQFLEYGDVVAITHIEARYFDAACKWIKSRPTRLRPHALPRGQDG